MKIDMSKLVCSQNNSILDALEVIKGNGKGIVFLIDESSSVTGVLTDGDVRAALIEGCALTENARSIMNRNFVFARAGSAPLEMLKLVNEQVKVLPVLDGEGCVVDYLEWATRVHVPVAEPDLGNNELRYLLDAFLTTWISSTGQYITRFENEFSTFCGAKYGVAVANGTVAIHLALLALDIGPGDEVIVPDLTFAATANAVLHANATPVIVDVERESWCIDPKEIEKAITSRTKAIIPVHLYGQPCNMTEIMEIARKHGLFVVEDCAEAHGAEFEGRKVGSFGDIGCFSFFGNKVITTGEGGMCVTQSNRLDERMRILRDHGMSKSQRYWHDEVGYNYRMTNLQAAIGVAQVERIESILESRRAVEERYRSVLSDVLSLRFQRKDLLGRKKITWLVSALVDPEIRGKMMTALKEAGIDSRPFFYSMGEMEIYKKYVFSNKVSIELSKSGLNFPTKLNLDDDYFMLVRSILLKL